MKTLIALAVGLMSLVVTVAIVVGIENATDFSLFTLMIWFVVPAGAFITGLLPAFAFYFAADKINLKATRLTGVVMVALAAAVQWAIYFARWKMVPLPAELNAPVGAHASDYIGFGEFVQSMLTNTQYQIGSTSSTSFNVGVFGYVIALLQFAAVSSAGLAAYFALKGRPYCDECQCYPDEKHKLVFSFLVPDEQVRAAMHAHQTATVEYLVGVHALPGGGDSGFQLKLLHCKGPCQRYLVQEQPVTRKNGQWVVGTGSRVLWAERGVNLEDTFRSLQIRGAPLGAGA